MDLAKLVTSIEGMKSTHKLVMLVILNFMNSNTRKCYPSIEKISRLAGVSESTVKTVIKELNQGEWIVVDSGMAKGDSNNYFFNEVKIVSQAKSQGINFDQKTITPLPQVEQKVAHKRNTSGLKQNQIKNEAPRMNALNKQPPSVELDSSFEYDGFSGADVPEWMDHVPELDCVPTFEATVSKKTDSIIIPPKNEDGSPPFFRNGTRRYSWNDTQKPA